MAILTPEYLRGRLAAPGVDFQAVAKQAGVSARMLYRIRNDVNSPSLDKAVAILAALDKLYPEPATRGRKGGK